MVIIASYKRKFNFVPEVCASTIDKKRTGEIYLSILNFLIDLTLERPRRLGRTDLARPSSDQFIRLDVTDGLTQLDDLNGLTGLDGSK